VLALGAVGAGFGLLTLRYALGGSFGSRSWTGAVAELGAGWALIAVGMVEAVRRPASQEGWLIYGAGIGWFFADCHPALGQ
jgi:hypothetical protein